MGSSLANPSRRVRGLPVACRSATRANASYAAGATSFPGVPDPSRRRPRRRSLRSAPAYARGPRQAAAQELHHSPLAVVRLTLVALRQVRRALPDADPATERRERRSQVADRLLGGRSRGASRPWTSMEGRSDTTRGGQCERPLLARPTPSSSTAPGRAARRWCRSSAWRRSPRASAGSRWRPTTDPRSGRAARWYVPKRPGWRPAAHVTTCHERVVAAGCAPAGSSSASSSTTERIGVSS